ncbi:phospholipase D-like domain-containing protein [Hymenobacter chitinivorans]|uniref:phospholipase D n=1 Tax=Hymenobacter chitinivorans DSM 11115 TaxID=1121954 RepID=A0A2M9BS15_9BACT|nr:phospholipase D-like domain-containing protein [Hymenobacter chitinivorans]PJJ60749.1 putative secreted protein (Por secretion system target) [Hymenobacter chitinivorans DSM 11115]
MKKSTLLALLTLGAGLQPALAQTVESIASARAKGAGSTVTVRGTVSNGAELGVIRYVQDKQAGLAAYSTTTAFSNLVPGDSVEIQGTLKNYNGLLEMDPVTSVTVLASNRPLTITEVPVSAGSSVYAESFESRLVRINGSTSITSATGSAVSTFAGNTNYLLNGSSLLVIRPNTASTGPTGLVGKPTPTGPFDLVGIMSQFSSTSTGGYQLLPRVYADVIQGGTPNILSAPMPTSITTSGFTVKFTTANAGSTQLSYSESPAGPFTSLGSATGTQSTQHTLAVTGLLPAKVYYVQAVSTNSVGRSESRVTPMITASQSSGKMRAYFTNPVNTARALPGNNAVYLPNGAIADTIARYINKATQTLDIAIYNWNSATILNAVNAAQARGVAVRVLFENDNTNVSIQGLSASIPRVGRSTTQNIMHNKFVIIDAESTNPNVPWVWTGSTNWTPAQLSTDRNNAIAIQDQALARVYTMEMNEMWGGGTTATALFGSRKTDNTPHYLNIGGKLVESWFSPTDNVNNRLIETIQTADNDLHIATMLITQTEIGRAVRDQVSLKNIASCTEVLLDDTTSSSASGGIYRTMKSAIGNRMVVNGSLKPGIMHHKYVIVDAGASLSDPQVFVGSHNWSAAANTENDENTLIVHDARIVNQYYQEFSQRIADYNTGIVLCNLILANKTATVQQSSVQAYPNPTHGRFQLRVEASKARTATITLRDVTGRVALTQTQTIGAGEEVKVDASSLKAGLYMVQIVTPESTQTSRVVVE